VAFGADPDGRLLLASGGYDKTVQVWDPFSGARAGEPLVGHMGPVYSVAFGAGPDGRLLLASGSDDKTVRIWDPATGVCNATLRRRSSIRSITAAGVALAIGDDQGISVIELDG
jgi:WD40 repeat protein